MGGGGGGGGVGGGGAFLRENITDFPLCNGTELCIMADLSKLPVKTELLYFILNDLFKTN